MDFWLKTDLKMKTDQADDSKDCSSDVGTTSPEPMLPRDELKDRVLAKFKKPKNNVRKPRTEFDPIALQAFESEFSRNRYPDWITIETLARSLDIKDCSIIQTWFSNRRNRLKKKLLSGKMDLDTVQALDCCRCTNENHSENSHSIIITRSAVAQPRPAKREPIDGHYAVSRLDATYGASAAAQNFTTSPPGGVSVAAVDCDWHNMYSKQFRLTAPPLLVSAVNPTVSSGESPAGWFAYPHQPRWPPSGLYERTISSRYSPVPPAVFPFCYSSESTPPQYCSVMPRVDRFYCALKHQFAQLMAVQLQQPLMPSSATILRHLSSTSSHSVAAADSRSIWSTQPLNLSSCPATPEDCDKGKTSVCWRPGGGSVNY